MLTFLRFISSQLTTAQKCHKSKSPEYSTVYRSILEWLGEVTVRASDL